MFDPTNPYGGDYADAFASPHNPVNTNPGNWQVNPLYLTPGYTANMRPSYGGPTGNTGPYQSNSWWRAVAQNNPMSVYSTPLWMNSDLYRRQNNQAVAERPIDSAMSFTQNWVAPTAAFLAANKVMGMQFANSGAYAGAMNGAKAMFGMPTAGTLSFGGRMGQNLMGGLTRGALGRFASTGMGAGIVGGASFLGGAIGSIAAPLAAGMALSSAADAMFFDPYISTRRGTDAIRSNFANTYMMDGGTNSGFGISSSKAHRISSELTRSGINDFALNTGDYNIIGDYAAQSGLMNNISKADTTQITKRIKDIAAQVKVVMAIANEPDVKEAVQMLGRLKSAGATDVGGFAGSILRNIGNNSAIAGISTRQMMETVGAQGQYVFQQNGLAGFLGMRESARAMGAFSSAYRTGSLGNMMSNLLGGVEGATQYSTEGMAKLANSNYFKMQMANRFMYGKDTVGMMNTLGTFGSNFAANPTSGMGYMNLFGDAMASAALSTEPEKVWQQLFESARILPGSMKNGKIDAGVLGSVMNQYGLDQRQALSMMQQLNTYSNRGNMDLMTGALGAQFDRNSRDLAEGYGNYGGAMGGVILGARNIGKGFKEFGATISDVPAALGAGLSDSFDGLFDEYVLGMENSNDYRRRSRQAKSIQGFLGNGPRTSTIDEVIYGSTITKTNGRGDQMSVSDPKTGRQFWEDLYNASSGSDASVKAYRDLMSAAKTRDRSKIEGALQGLIATNPSGMKDLMGGEGSATFINNLTNSMIKSNFQIGKASKVFGGGDGSNASWVEQVSSALGVKNMSTTDAILSSGNINRALEILGGDDWNSDANRKEVRGLASKVGLNSAKYFDKYGNFIDGTESLKKLEADLGGKMDSLSRQGTISIAFSHLSATNPEDAAKQMLGMVDRGNLTKDQIKQIELLRSGKLDSKAAGALADSLSETALKSLEEAGMLEKGMTQRGINIRQRSKEEQDAFREQILSQTQEFGRMKSFREMAGKVDFQTFNAMSQQIESDTTKKFADSVNKFEKSVEMMAMMSDDDMREDIMDNGQLDSEKLKKQLSSMKSFLNGL